MDNFGQRVKVVFRTYEPLFEWNLRSVSEGRGGREDILAVVDDEGRGQEVEPVLTNHLMHPHCRARPRSSPKGKDQGR